MLRVAGPLLGQDRICALGQLCSVTGIIGTALSEGDLVRVTEEGGRCDTHVTTFPGTGISNAAQPNWVAGIDFTFGTVRDLVKVLPGNYTLCWCSAGSTCLPPTGVAFGELEVQGAFESHQVPKG